MFDQQVTFLYTRDLDLSAAFYGETLGLHLVLDQGGCRIYRVSPDGFLGLCRCSESRPCNPEGVIVTFETPPRDNPAFNIYHCFLRDPDGYQIEIQRFDDPAWPKPAVPGNR